MSRLLRSQTLIRSTTSAFFSSAARTRAVRRLSTLSDSSSQAEESGSKEVEKIEDLIQSFIESRSRPDWLTFVPGGSYWVPPRRTSCDIAGIVETLANALTEEEYLSLTTAQGWPSSAFYIHNDTSSHQLSHLELPPTLTVHEEEG